MWLSTCHCIVLLNFPGVFQFHFSHRYQPSTSSLKNCSTCHCIVLLCFTGVWVTVMWPSMHMDRRCQRRVPTRNSVEMPRPLSSPPPIPGCCSSSQPRTPSTPAWASGPPMSSSQVKQPTIIECSGTVIYVIYWCPIPSAIYPGVGFRATYEFLTGKTTYYHRV